MNNQQQPQQIPVKISDEVLKGSYSNQTRILHTKDEFVMDFISYTPGDPNAAINNRVILSPVHFKSLVEAMRENLEKYEKQFGKLQPAQQEKHNFGFDTNQAQ